MSNSIVFLMIAVGLSVLGSLVVWIHGRIRRRGTSVDHFNRGLRALAANGGRHEPTSGITLRRASDDDEPPAPTRAPAPAAPVDDASSARPRRPSPRPSPRPVNRSRPQESRPQEHEGSRPGS
jgi:hypothetical protein